MSQTFDETTLGAASWSPVTGEKYMGSMMVPNERELGQKHPRTQNSRRPVRQAVLSRPQGGVSKAGAFRQPEAHSLTQQSPAAALWFRNADGRAEGLLSADQRVAAVGLGSRAQPAP